MGIPVAFALGLAGVTYLLVIGAHPSVLASQMFASLSATGLLTIPFFIMAAEILSRSGATQRLVNVFVAFLGHTRGGLPVVSVISTAFFSAICGSSVATAAAVGVVLIPELIRRGYDKLFAIGLIACSGGLGILIPPSIPLIIYGMVTEQSIRALFVAGLVAGVILTAALCVVAYIYAVRSGVPVEKKASWEERVRALRAAAGVLLMPVIVLGGIYGGIFTPTEASAISAVYAIGLAIAYKVPLRDFLPMLTASASMATVILLILASAQLFGYALTAERVPHHMFQYINALGLEPWMFMALVMAFFIICGLFLEVISIILITMPIILPLLEIYDIDPIHFGILLILNMELAVITPPIGLNLFVISAISGVPVLSVFRGALPFAAMLLLVLLVLAFVPGAGLIFSSL